MKIHKDVPFYTYITIFLLLFISFSEYIYKKIANLKVVVRYIEESNGELITLYFVPITIMAFIYFYFIWINKHTKHDVIFLFIFIAFTVTRSELTIIFKPFPILIFYVITSLFLLGFFTKLMCRGKTDTDIDSFDIINNDSEITTLKDNKRDCFKYLLKSFMLIIETHTDHSLSISISGEWGSGKSSFLNLIKDELLTKKNNYKILEFYPWRCDSEENITITFFTLLADVVSSDRALSRSIQQYISVLVPESNTLTRIVHSFSHRLNQNDLYYDIETGLNKYKKKIIVFIDDLDRLEKDELLAVLKIIRNSGKFKNIIFISAIDRKQVSKITERDVIFLDKFFQHDRSIPRLGNMEKVIIFKQLFDNNKEILTNNGITYNDDVPISIIEQLSNIRDMKIYLSRLNIALIQQKSISNLCTKIIKNDSNYKFEYLDNLKMSYNSLSIASCIMVKYPELIRNDESYLEELKAFVSYPVNEEQYYKTNKELNIKSKNIYSKYLKDHIVKEFPEFELITSTKGVKYLFSELFRPNESKAISFDKNIPLYFDNYSNYSISELTILMYEFDCVVENIFNYTDENLKEIISASVFKFIRSDIFKNVYSSLLKEKSHTKKIRLLKLINFTVSLEISEDQDFYNNFYKDTQYGLFHLIDIYFDLESKEHTFDKSKGIDQLLDFLLNEKLNKLFEIDFPVRLFGRINQVNYPISVKLLLLFDAFIKNYYLKFDFVGKYFNKQEFTPSIIIDMFTNKDDLLNTFSEIFVDESFSERIKFIESFIDVHNKDSSIDVSEILLHLFSTNNEKLKKLYRDGKIYLNLMDLYPYDSNKITTFIYKILNKQRITTENLFLSLKNYFPTIFSEDLKKKKLDTILENLSQPDGIKAPIRKDSQGCWQFD